MNFNEVNTGYDFMQERKPDLELENLEAALKLHPNNVELQQKVKRLYASKADQACINEAKHRREALKGICELNGIELDDRIDIDEIITEYSRNSNHPFAKNILSSAYYIQGLLFDSKRDYLKSAKAYKLAIDKKPEYPLAFNKLGWANLAIGNYDDAIKAFKKANLNEAELKKRLANIYTRRGVAHAEKKNYDQAIEDLTQAIELNPNANRYLSRGNCYLEKEDYGLAFEDYNQAIRLDPNDVNAFISRGYAYAKKKDYDQAIDDFTQVIKQNPDNVDAYYNRAFVYQSKNDYNRAIEDYNQVIRLDPNDADAKKSIENLRQKRGY